MRRQWLGIFVGLGLGGGLGFILTNESLFDPLAWIPVFIVSVAIHEIGHLTSGKLVGMDPGGIAVCGLVIFRSGPNWRWRFDPRLLMGGLAQPLPKKGEFEPRRYAWVVAGGPLATMLLVVASGVAWKLSGQPAGWISSFLWVNAILAALSLLPLAGATDGAKLWMLLRDPERSRGWMAVAQVMAQDAQGVMPRDWDPHLIAQLLPYDEKMAETALRQMLAYYRRADEGDETTALEHLELALAAAGRARKAIRHLIFTDAAYCSALARGNPAAARSWMARARKERRPVSVHGVEAAIAQSESRYEDAVRSWDAALAFLAKRKLESGTSRFSRNTITRAREQCLEAIRSAENPQQREQASGV